MLVWDVPHAGAACVGVLHWDELKQQTADWQHSQFNSQNLCQFRDGCPKPTVCQVSLFHRGEVYPSHNHDGPSAPHLVPGDDIFVAPCLK